MLSNITLIETVQNAGGFIYRIFAYFKALAFYPVNNNVIDFDHIFTQSFYNPFFDKVDTIRINLGDTLETIVETLLKLVTLIDFNDTANYFYEWVLMLLIPLFVLFFVIGIIKKFIFNS